MHARAYACKTTLKGVLVGDHLIRENTRAPDVSRVADEVQASASMMSLSFSSRDRALAREVGQRWSPVALRLYHLRGEIIRCANHRLGRLERVRQHATDAEVSELRHAILG